MLALLLSLSLSEPETVRSVPRPPTSESRIRHFECFNIVRLTEHSVTIGRSPENITALLTTHCDKIADTRKNICLSLVPAKIPTILAQLQDKKHPEDICTSLGFERLVTYSRTMEKEKCVKIVDQLKEYQKTNESIADAEPRFPKLPGSALSGSKLGFQRRFFGAPKFCREMEKEDRISCNIVTRVALRKTKTELDTGVASATICDKLQETKYLNFSVPTTAA
jgi:hypothetical protein